MPIIETRLSAAITVEKNSQNKKSS